jgi:hypothetical protein
MTVVQSRCCSEATSTEKLPERMICDNRVKCTSRDKCDQPLQHGRLKAMARIFRQGIGS